MADATRDKIRFWEEMMGNYWTLMGELMTAPVRDVCDNPVRCEHGGLIDVDGTVSCQLCDWCVACESVTVWDGEFCTACGREWGSV